MSVVFLFLLPIFELIQQAALVNFMLYLNISFSTFSGKNCVEKSLALWALFPLKVLKAFRIVQCKEPQLVKL